jgi:GntR family transcriptional regulator, rspAB operon transcriptional repressor
MLYHVYNRSRRGGDHRAVHIVSVKTIGQQVYERLLHDVLAGVLVPGAWLRELDIALLLGVSRTPVREAVRRLAQDGLLEMSPNRGVQVRALSVAEAVDAYDVRELVEGSAARSAAVRASPADVVELRRLLTVIEELDPADAVAHVHADNAFHEAIARAAGSDALLAVTRLLTKRVTRIKLVTRDTNASVATRAQHEAIVAAIAAGDADAAEGALRRHIRTYRDLVASRLGGCSGGIMDFERSDPS